MPSEFFELYEAMRLYTAAALQLLAKQCPEGPPTPLHFFDEWKRDSDGHFRLYDQSQAYWVNCIRSNLDALHNLDECRRLLTVLRSTPHIAEQMDQPVGAAGVGAQRLEAHDMTDRLIWSLPQSTGGLHFDEQVFDTQFRQLSTDLRRSEFSFIVLVPLLGLTAESLPITLGPEIEIDPMTDEEIVRCLRLRMLPEGLNFSTSRIADVQSNIAVRVQYHLPKRVGEHTAEGVPNPIVSEAQDLAVSVLRALRVFKEGKVSIPGVLNFPIDWPLQGWTSFTFTNPGLMPWTNKYSLFQDEAKAFQLFWSHFRHATSKAVLANAVRRFSYASERERPDDRLVDLMIAAESLFLGGEDNPTDRGELRYRLALRAAFFIDHKAYSRREVFDHMRRAYDGRSAIVHGGGEPKSSTLRSPKDVPTSLHDFSELTAGLMRMALKKGIDVAADTKGTTGPLLDWTALIIPRCHKRDIINESMG